MSQNSRRAPESRWGWLLPAAIIAVGVAEIMILVLLGRSLSIWFPLVLVLLGVIIGFALVVAAGAQSFTRLRSLVRAFRGRGDVQEHMSRPVFTLLAAAAFAFPGPLTDVLGIVLLLTPVQRSAVRRSGLSSASGGARRVMLRSRSGVVAGSIVVENENRTANGAGDSSHQPLSGRVIEQ